MKRPHSSRTAQKLIRQIITWMLIAELGLFGVQAENRIELGDSPVKVLICLINQSVPVLKQLIMWRKNLEENNHK